MDISLTYITLFVSEVETVRDWYVRHLGLRAETDSGQFVRLVGTEGAMLGLHRGAPAQHPERIQIHFQVLDVDAFCRRLMADGVTFDREPSDAPWGLRVASLRDPAGHTVEIYSP